MDMTTLGTAEVTEVTFDVSRYPPSRKHRLKLRLYDKQEGRCAYCKRAVNLLGRGKRQAILEHRIPRFAGGEDRESNVVLACYECDVLKGSLTSDQIRALADAIDAATPTREEEGR